MNKLQEFSKQISHATNGPLNWRGQTIAGLESTTKDLAEEMSVADRKATNWMWRRPRHNNRR